MWQIRAKLARLQYDRAEVVPSWHDFSMTWQSRVKLERFVHMKLCQIDTTCLNL